MFPQLPEELERLIWKKYYDSNILIEIKWFPSVWEKPTEALFKNSSDYGAIQIGYTDLERLYDDTIPHTSYMEFILDVDDTSYNWSCEDCVYGMFGKCHFQDRDKNMSYNCEKWWDLSYYF